MDSIVITPSHFHPMVSNPMMNEVEIIRTPTPVDLPTPNSQDMNDASPSPSIIPTPVSHEL